MIDAVYRAESRCVLATLLRLLGGFELAEEALHEAFAAAVEQWPREGMRVILAETQRHSALPNTRNPEQTRTPLAADSRWIADKTRTERGHHCRQIERMMHPGGLACSATA